MKEEQLRQLKNVIERLNTRIPLTDNDDKFDRMIFFKHGEGVHISEYDAWIKIVMEAAETFAEILPLLEKLKIDDSLANDLITIEHILTAVFPEKEKDEKEI